MVPGPREKKPGRRPGVGRRRRARPGGGQKGAGGTGRPGVEAKPAGQGRGPGRRPRGGRQRRHYGLWGDFESGENKETKKILR